MKALRLNLIVVMLVLLVLFGMTSKSASANHVPGHVEASAEITFDTTLATSTSEQYQFSRSGIFGCNLTGSYSMSVGALSAVGGVYVPVSDAAVTLNTGYLVYKECVLDGVNRKFAESAVTGLVKKGLTDFLTVRDGRPGWPEDYIADVVERSDRAVLRAIESGELAVLNPALYDEVTRAIVRDYMAETRDPTSLLECPSRVDIRAVTTNPTQQRITLADFAQLGQRPCNLFFARDDARNFLESRIARDRQEFDFRLTTGQGIYGIEEYDPVTGRYITKTPGILVLGNVQQLISSGLRQQENVTEIDQMVGALFSGLSTQVISDSQGLTGLLQSNLGQPSYLDQMARESAQGLRDSAINAALQILAGARQVETAYYNAMNAIGLSLTGAIGQLRQAENGCWALVVPQAQNYASQHNFQIQVATSTTFSQQVIDSQIAPLATTTIANIQKSERALTLINQLIAGITNTTSLEAQRIALQQLDSLVAQGQLHNQYDAQQAVQRQGEIEAAMESLVEDTITAWADSTDLNVGWCNVNNPDIPRTWAERWKI